MDGRSDEVWWTATEAIEAKGGSALRRRDLLDLLVLALRARLGAAGAILPRSTRLVVASLSLVSGGALALGLLAGEVIQLHEDPSLVRQYQIIALASGLGVFWLLTVLATLTAQLWLYRSLAALTFAASVGAPIAAAHTTLRAPSLAVLIPLILFNLGAVCTRDLVRTTRYIRFAQAGIALLAGLTFAQGWHLIFMTQVGTIFIGTLSLPIVMLGAGLMGGLVTVRRRPEWYLGILIVALPWSLLAIGPLGRQPNADSLIQPSLIVLAAWTAATATAFWFDRRRGTPVSSSLAADSP